VAAKPAPPPPTLAASDQAPSDPVVFSTERAVTLTPARLAALYSIDPGADRYADHSARSTGGFTLFDTMRLTPHHLYLGHDTLFKIGGHVTLIVSFLLDTAAREPVRLEWEYFTNAGWMPLPFEVEDDTTGGLTASGQVTLRHACGPDAKKRTIAGRESYWLRARLATPLTRDGIAPLITINDVRVRAAFGKANLRPDAAFADGQALDVSKDFHPFGLFPAVSSAFYLACKDVFERPGATAKIAFTLSDLGAPQPVGGTAFALEWEFTTAAGWEPLSILEEPKAFQFERTPHTMTFVVPPRWVEREVNGVSQRWLRARIAGGDYGQPLRVKGLDANSQPEFADANLKPPRVQKAILGFEYLTDVDALDHCVVYNDFAYGDVTEAARWPDRKFVPFVPVADPAPAVRLGFDRALPNGLVSLFLDVPDDAIETPSPSPLVWEYRAADEWRELPVLDETCGFRQRGMIQFVGPQDASAMTGLGDQPLFWLRARLKQGEANPAARCNGLWLNAIWAAERRLVEREIVGRSDGHPRQTFQLRRAPVLEIKSVEVEEWAGRGEAWRNALPEVAERDIRFERDPVTREPVTAWVPWYEQPHFFASSARDRHYVVERATGQLRFGNFVPIAGQRIAVTYSSGGGLAGNVAPGGAKELRTAAPFLAGVTNVVAARGGAAVERKESILARGPQQLRHRNRGIAAHDLEWLALEASPGVARVRCLPLQGPDGRAQRGWITLVVVPWSLDSRPALDSELARMVRDHVAARLPATARIRIVGPHYAAVALRAVIVPIDASLAAVIEARVRAALDRYLHPLHGGSTGGGWTFGESLYLSQVSSTVEGVEGVDHAEDVTARVDGVIASMTVEIPRDRMMCGGAHELVMRPEVR
jgi:hypothetical protein